MSEEKEFINVRKLIAIKNPKLLKWLPGFVVKYLVKIVHQDEINAFIIANKDVKNEHFCKAVIDYFNVNIEMRGIENIPKEGPVTLAMNHPLGGNFNSRLNHLALFSGPIQPVSPAG